MAIIEKRHDMIERCHTGLLLTVWNIRENIGRTLEGKKFSS